MSCACIGSGLKSEFDILMWKQKLNSIVNAEGSGHSVPVCQTAESYLSFSPERVIAFRL